MSLFRGTVGPNVAGSWYPRDPGRLAREVDGFLDSESPGAPPRALVVPHAGYVYSGRVAGRGFATIRGGGYRRVVLMGPAHFHPVRGAALPGAASYATPLGPVPIEVTIATALLETEGVEIDDRAFVREHSLECELPFLQRLLEPGFTVLPLLVGAWETDALSRLASSLEPWLEPETLVVVSSDFTHYGRAFGYVPFVDEVPQSIEALDRGAIDRMVAGDGVGFRAYCDETGATICGRRAIEVLLRLMPGLDGELIAYDTSGHITGDWDLSVSYASLAFGDHRG